jgi:hypothetical protein
MTMLLLALACKDRPAGPNPITYEPTCEEGDPITLDTVPTWSSGVGQLVADKCTGCHVEGGIGPFTLTSYADAAPMAAAMANATGARRMPPWMPSSCGDCQTWEHDRSLTDEQIATIQAWADNDAPEGDGGDFAPAAGVELAHVDATADPMVEFTPPTTPADNYRCFLVDAPTDSRAFLTGYEVVPGNPAVVHHVLLYQPVSAETAAEAEALDAAEDGEGYTCFGGAGVNAVPVAIWAPGTGATVFPAGTGLPLSGEKLVLQIHYNVGNGTGADRTTVDLQIEDDVDFPASFERVQNTDIALAPGEEQIQLDYEQQLGGDGSFRVWGMLPHMHELGQSMSVHAVDGGEDTCLVDVPAWDFHWQGVYFYEEPVTVAGDATIQLTCVYDTTSRTETTYAGEGTEDEMCLSFAYVSL